MINLTTLYIVIPCYNEEAVIPETAKRLKEKYEALMASGMISEKSRILFINNGSHDKTWELIKELHEKDKVYSGLSLPKNCGHQNGVLAGLMQVKDICDCAISMDADLQDDINAIDEMVNLYNNEGTEIVYGVRSSRKKDTFFKRFTAESFYKFMKAMGVDIVFNHADFRLMSNRALQALSEYKEVNLFLRGIVPLIGLKSDNVYYERHERFAGKSKYPLNSMISLAVNGITSFSVKPLKIITGTGIIISVLSVVAFLFIFIAHFVSDKIALAGWPSIMCSIWFLGGIQIFFIGIIGEYIGKMYAETKQRPRYFVEDFLNDNDDE